LRLSNGDTLGPYQIVAPLGAGGMGEVYRARDERLGRDVAIKVLPATRASDEHALARFEREAKAVAALSHPNILAIHDFGREGDLVFTVSELLEGETLGERLKSTPLPMRKAIDVGAQMARGLAAAHSQGIVHRDLKPDNVFLTHDGQVKVLDFGLATMEQTPISEEERTQTRMPAQTDPGTVLGTVGYMSPEQVRGHQTDHRSDIFTLGAILYEMLAGRRAFAGSTPADTSSAILSSDPPELHDLDRDVPPGIEMLIRRCLEKNPEERFQSASDLAFDLERLSGSSIGMAAVTGPAAGPSRLKVGLLGLLILLVVGAAVVGAYVAGLRAGGSEAPEFTRLTYQRGSIRSARMAPDGQTVVYGAAWDGQPIRIFNTRAGSPVSSRIDLPDADILAVSSQGEMAISIGRTFLSPHENTGTLARVALAGGAPRMVLEDVQQADWSPDGSELAAVHEVDGRNRLEYPVGTVLYETAGWISSPRVSPDGERIAFLDHDMRWDNVSRVATVDREGNVVRLGPATDSEGLAWSPSGDEIWFAGGLDEKMARGIYAVGLDGEVRKVYQQAADLLLFDVLADGRALVGSSFQRREVRVGAGGEERDLSWLDWSLSTFLSRDGRKVLINEQGEGGVEGYSIYLRDTDGSPPVHIGAGIPFALSPDGRWVLGRTPESRLALMPTGPGAPKVFTADAEVLGGVWGGWSPDGRQVVFGLRDEDGTPSLYLYDVEQGSRRAVAAGLAIDAFSDPFAPDGRRLFAVDPSRVPHIVSIDGGDPVPIQGLEPGDSVSRWSDDGRHLFFYRKGIPAEYGRYEIAGGRREILGTLAPRDRAGAVGVWPALFSGDGSIYAYSYPRFLTGLYLVDGLR
jgi:Tol biopolymer transport system component